MNDSTSKHYDERYFSWQSSIGEFGGWANLPKFAAFVSEDDVVLDFGCGGGYLLKNLQCKVKLGIEINEAAAQVALNNGVAVYSSSSDVPDDCANVVISNHTLEHTYNPLEELRILNTKLKKGGKIVLVVPCETIYKVYEPHDINNHLYSWSPMCLGNLLKEAGYRLIESKAYIHKWPPHYELVARVGGRTLFEYACRIYGRIERSWFQVRATAERPTD